MLRIQSGQQVRPDITDVWRVLVHCFQNVLYVAAIQLEKAGLDHLLRHILAVDADGRSGRADSIKEMLAIAESSRPWIHHRKRKGRSLHNRGCDQSLIRKYFLMNGNGIDASDFSPDASIPFRSNGGDTQIWTGEWGFCRPLPYHLAMSPLLLFYYMQFEPKCPLLF